MLGSIAEAEDVVQSAYLRWTTAANADVTNPQAYLARIVSRLCLDRMKSAAARREQYVGTWLPEPFVEPVDAVVGDDLSVALLLTLERLSPLERAAFLLHDVFDMEYAEIAETLGRTEIACRQLAARGRQRVRDERPRFKPSPEATARLADAFASALAEGKLDTLADLLAADVVVYTDGGGKRVAALNPIYGREKVVRFLEGTTKKSVYGHTTRIERATINGLPLRSRDRGRHGDDRDRDRGRPDREHLRGSQSREVATSAGGMNGPASRVVAGASWEMRHYVFGLQALMLLPLTPLQSKSERHSSLDLQIFTHVTVLPETESQTEPSGHSEVDPEVVHAVVQ